MPSIVFEPLGMTIECATGETVFAAARRHNVPIPTACVGRGTCGLCRVKVVAGEEALSPINSTEKRHLGNTYFITKLRLSCQVQIGGAAAAATTPPGTDGEKRVTLLIPDAVKNLKRLAQLKP
ncbi:MAG TPA: 2Fe-2S iron-sulfur cluster-binding protein [Pseudomonadota bacterium]|nr:2Fe-2S iron-sulfur cluster-binding protein [Pseudomonadota bacterium]